MGFFDAAEKTDGTVAIGGGEPIPDGTQLLAVIDSAAWDEYEGIRTIKITWTALKPSRYANRKVFQKVKVEDADPAKRKRQMTMLAAIATNAGGGLLAVDGEPNDAELARHLAGKQMLIKVGVWEMNGNSGNWVSAVAPKAAVEEVEDDLPVGGITNGGGSVPF